MVSIVIASPSRQFTRFGVLQNEFPWLSGLVLAVCNFQRFGPNNASLNLDSVTLVNSVHFTYDIDVFINNSNLGNYQLKFWGRTTSQNSAVLKEHQNQLVMYHSQLYRNKTGKQTSIQVYNGFVRLSAVSASGLKQAVPVVKVSRRSHLIMDATCVFKRNELVRWKDTAALEIINGSVAHISDSVFEHNVGIGCGAVRITTNSRVDISNCEFTRNRAKLSGPAIYAAHCVNVNVSDSRFTENSAYHHAGAIFSVYHVNFTIQRTNFSGNNAVLSNGGCITGTGSTAFYIEDCYFLNNTGKRGGVLHADNNCSVTVEHSHFRNNLATRSSGVFAVSNFTSLALRSCEFLNNTATLTQSVLTINYDGTLIIEDCVFDQNPSAFTGFLEAANVIKITVTNSVFTRNSADVGSVVEIGRSKAWFENCSFVDNRGGSLFYGHYEASLTFRNCTFSNHTLAADPLMVMSDCGLNLEKSRFLNNTQNKEGGIVIAKSGTNMTVTESYFARNHASKGSAFYLSHESHLYVISSRFEDNSAGDGGIAYLLDSHAMFLFTEVHNTSSTGYGGVITGLNSKIEVLFSTFSNNTAVLGGCFYLETNGSLYALESVFEYSRAQEGGAVYKFGGPGNVSLDHCTLNQNYGGFGGAIYAKDINYLRLAGGVCNKSHKRDCITYECMNRKAKCQLYTYNYTMTDGVHTLNSHTTPNFTSTAQNLSIIHGPINSSNWMETPFANCEFSFVFPCHGASPFVSDKLPR